VNDRNLYAIILAGGSGQRLASTTTKLYGHALPKQFASFGRSRTFLQQTLDRIRPLVAPERTVVVVAEEYEDLARDQLAGLEGIEIVPQPANAGTGPGVLLPLLRVLRRDAHADVAVIPSDHDIRQPSRLLDALARARLALRRAPAEVVLLGAGAESPATDLGWIVAGPEAGGVSPVHAFVEKPDRDHAERLYRAGALWNTMITVARGAALWRLAGRHLPEQTELLSGYAAHAGDRAAMGLLRRLYEMMPPACYSRDLLAAADGLGAVALHESGWSDCGTPDRLALALSAPPARSGVFVRNTRGGLQPAPSTRRDAIARRSGTHG
jgi:mannose-1-phosphate guanylyltransferase